MAARLRADLRPVRLWRTRIGLATDGTLSRGTKGLSGNTVTAGATSALAGGMFQCSFYHYGQSCELMLADTSTSYMVRVDGEYVGLDTVDTRNTFYKLDFGARALRRIDLIGNGLTFYGVNVEPGDTIVAAPIRGPRAIVLGDSFSTPSALGWHAHFADALGWDDVWAAGVGGTGFVATNGGAAKKFYDRIASDVIAHAPDIVIIPGSVNDSGADPAMAEAEAQACVSLIRSSLPDCLMIGGYSASGGVETMSAGALAIMAAVEAGFVAAGGVWLNPIEMPLVYVGGVLPSSTLAAAHAAGKVGANPDSAPFAGGSNTASQGLYCNATVSQGVNLRVGSTVEIGSGPTCERVVITGLKQITGTTLSYAFDGTLRYAHASGETVREVGPSYLTGRGKAGATTGWGNADELVTTDGTHPSPAGHEALGLIIAGLLRDCLSALSATERAKHPGFAL
jgi:lysophospholipase L1-like esterase